MKTKLRHPTIKELVFVLVSIIFIQTLLLWYFGSKIDILWTQVNGSGSPQQQLDTSLSALPFKSAVKDAYSGLYKNEGVLNIEGTKVYFPELHIYLPYSALARDLKYSVSTDNSSPQNAAFSSKSLLNLPIQHWNDVHCLQFIAGLTVNQDDQSTWQQNSTSAGKVSLADGRTLYLHKNGANDCAQTWVETTPDKVIELLKQAQSY